MVGSRSSCHRLQTATGAERCANAGTAQRARNGRRAYPANRHHVCTCRRSCVRRLTISIPIGAAFGYDTRTHTEANSYRFTGPSRPHERSSGGRRAAKSAPWSRSFGRAAPKKFRLEPGSSTGFGPQTPVVDRGLGVTNRGFRLGGAETTVVRSGLSTRPSRNPASRRRKARSAGAGFRGKSAVRGTETTAADHYRTPDHSVGRSFLACHKARVSGPVFLHPRSILRTWFCLPRSAAP